jgi:excisionase family DNA binding protein
METMLTARQVAEYLGLRENWVYDRAIVGDLPSYKLGGSRRFRRSEVEAWLCERRQQTHESSVGRSRPAI